MSMHDSIELGRVEAYGGCVNRHCACIGGGIWLLPGKSWQGYRLVQEVMKVAKITQRAVAEFQTSRTWSLPWCWIFRALGLKWGRV